MTRAYTLFHWGLYEVLQPVGQNESSLVGWDKDEAPSPIGLVNRLSDFDQARIAVRLSMVREREESCVARKLLLRSHGMWRSTSSLPKSSG